jgi:hypothetical protein
MTITHMVSLVKIGVSQTFCPSWPQILIYQISISGVARITSVSHHVWLNFYYFFYFLFLLALGFTQGPHTC